MEIWLDTTNLKAIKEAESMGLLYGVTTNPIIVSKQDKPLENLLETLLTCQTGPVAVQVVGDTAATMIAQAKRLKQFSTRLLIKVPATNEGMKVIKALKEEGISTMATAILEPLQGFLAAIAGAEYLAPYLSRMGETGMDKIGALNSISQPLGTKLLVASLRTPEQLVSCAKIGAAAVTINDQLFSDCTDPSEKMIDLLSLFNESLQASAASKLIYN